MQYIYSFFQENLMALLACVGLLVITRLKSRIGMKSVLPLRMGICVILALLVFDFADYQMSIVDYGGPWRYFTSTMGYILRPLECIFLMFQIKNNKKWHLFIIIPWLVYSLLFILNLPLHFIFYFTPGFQATGFGIIRIVFPILYMIALVFVSISSNNEKDKSEIILVCVSALAIIIATLFEWLDIVDTERVVIINPCVAICYVFYYLFLHIAATKRDPLTQLLNRQSFYDDFEKRKKEVTGVISIDMNNLKKINDNKGHFEGDKALICVSNIFKNSNTSKSRAYRVGGDEFMILCFNLKEEEILDLINKIKNDLSLTEYECAFGYSLKGVKSLNDTLIQADNNMYQDKRIIKESKS